MKSFALGKIAVLSLFFLSSMKSFSQLSTEDSIAYTASIQEATSVYHHALYPEESLYCGSQYYGYPFHFRNGQPCYNQDTETNGWIKYDGILYENVKMRYDLIREKVIVTHPGNHARMMIVNEKIEAFNIYNTTFIYIRPDSINKGILQNGLYGLLYDGSNAMLVKKNKKVIIEELTTTEGVLRDAEERNSYYLKQGALFHPVSSKKELLRLTGDKKKQVQQYIRRNDLDFKRDKENALVKAVAYYDTLPTTH